MKKLIYSIRKKPDHIKTRLVFVFAILATAIIVALWILTMQLLKTSDDTIKTESPLKVFGKIFNRTKDKIDDSLTVTTNETKSSEQNPVEEIVLPEPVLSTEN